MTEPTVGSEATIQPGAVPGVGMTSGAGPGAGGVGHPGVDAALAELSRAERLPPDQQIAVYESVHRTLQDTLRTIEQS